MKNNIWKKMIAGVLGGVMLTSAFPVTAAGEEKPAYLKAATYVSDAWVINFWSTESDHMDEELRQIANDGFNGIILVVPWREFQSRTSPVTYNSYAFEKFHRVMQAAQAQGLWVELRVGYTWDYYEYGEFTRFRDMLKDNGLRQAWLAYVARIYETVSQYPNFYGGFITWEDFWNFMEDAPSFGIGDYSVMEAKKIGFQKYLREHYSLSEINEAFLPETPFTSYDQIYIPKRDTLGYKMFFEYYDDFLVSLLKDAQKVFPDLSMEVRLDVDPVETGRGGLVGAPHFSTFPCGDSSYTSLMYSVAMGQELNTEISAASALDMMGKKLDEVRSYSGGKPVFVDQLLYMDNTEGFEANARLRASDRAAFLTSLPGVLRGRTIGYAVWSYRNYTNNALYNCQFALGSRGWETDRAKVVEHNGSRQMLIENGGQAAQQFSARLRAKETHENHVRFTAESDGPATLTVKIGSDSQSVRVDGYGKYDLNFGLLKSSTVSFTVEGGRIYLDNVDVYNFVQDGQLYDLDGGELSCIDAVRALNAQLN